MIIENTVAGTLITGTADNDSILNFGDDVTIDSGSGNDTVYSGLDDKKADRVSINAGEGDNVISIQGGSDSVTILTGDGNNLIGSTSPNNVVFTGEGNDSVTFYTGSDNNIVDSGDGDDSIDAVGHNVTINAGDGNDRIRTYRNAFDITIKAGMGDDDITLGGSVDTYHTNVVQYAEGDGNDTITTFSASDTIQITSGSISGAELVGNNVVINVGDGTITILEANNMNINILDADGILNQTIFSGGSSEDTVVNDTLIVGTDGDDYLLNDKGSNVTITGLGGNDTIENTGDNSIIDAGEGDNLVSVAGASFVTVTTGDGSNTVYSDSNGASGYFRLGDGNNSLITSNRYSTIIGGSGGNGITLHNGSFESSVEAGDGNDTIAVGHRDITVDAGAGNDLINLYRDAENSLILMGEGNDTVMVYNNQHEQTFQYSGGNDIITGFDADDTLRIAGYTSSSSIISDGNFILDFGDDSITLAGVSSTESLNIEYLGKWSTIEGGFVYSGHTTNNYEQTADVSLVGADLKDEDGDGAPDNVKVKVFKHNVLGVVAVMTGLSGEITLNNSPVGVIGDDDYEDHFTAKVRDDAPDSIIAYSKIRELRGISDGATVNATTNDMIAFDENAKVHFGDVENVSLNNKNWVNGSAHAQIGIANNDAGADLTIADSILTEISGLEDGYSISLVSSDNVSNELTFSTDGGQGTITAGETTLTADGESNFTVKLDEDGNIITGEWSTIDGGFVYSGHATNNYAKTADVSLIGADLKDEDGNGAPDNVTVGAFNYSSVTGVMAIMGGLSGEITLNNSPLGVIGDDDYEAHFTAKIIDGASDAVKRYAATKELRGISDGATVNVNANDIVRFDENAKVHMGDVDKFFLYNTTHKATGTPHAQIGIANNDAGADLTVEDDILTEIGGLEDGYSISLVSSDNVSDELTFSTDGGNGTIIAGETTLIVEGDENFAINITSDTNVISGLKNFNGSATLIGNETFDSYIALAIQRGSFTLDTDENYSNATLSNSSGESLNVYYTNDKTGGVIDLSDETLTNTLLIGQGEAATVIGSQGDDQLIGNSPSVIQIGNAGKDTFRGGANLEEVTISDYVEGEDVIYHGRPFADLSINGSIEGSDYVFRIGTRAITVKDGADKVIKGIDVNGESRNFGKYLTLDDNDPATVTAQSGVVTIDASLRTTDIEIIGSDDDNTILSGASNNTLTGSEGNDLFVYSAGNDIITDYSKDDTISIGSAISNSSVNGSDVIFNTESGSLTVQNAKSETLNIIDSSGENYSTIISGSEQIVKDFTGKSIENMNQITVTNSEELSAVRNAETSVINISGNQNADLTQFTNPQIVSLGSGQQNLQLSDKDGNIVIVDENSSGSKNIVLNGGADLGIFRNANVAVNVDMADAGNATLAPYAGQVKLNDYNYESGASIFVQNVSDISEAVVGNSVEIESDEIKTSSAVVKFNNAESSRWINFVAENGVVQKVGFVKNDTLDKSSESEDFLIKGDTDSTVILGNGNDTVLANSGTMIDAGNGRNKIYVTSDDIRNGAIIVASGKGSNTVYGFNTGYDDTSNRILVGSNSSVDAFDGENLKIYSDSATVELKNISSDNDFVEIMETNSDGNEYKLAVAQENLTITTGKELADIYVGKRSGVDFTEFEDDLYVDLGNTDNNENMRFYGINKVTAGKGTAVLIGNDARNTLVAGKDLTSISGGAGNDTLIGKGGSSDKVGQTVFYFSAGDGKDFISNFEFLTSENKNSSIDDRIDVNGSTIYDAYIKNNNVVLTFDQDSTLTIENAVGKNFRLADVIAKVDKNISYDGLANYYVASGGSSLNVDSSLDSAEIWLDNSHGNQFVGEIQTLNASAVKGKTKLIGNNFDDTILAGRGDSSLWGGSSASNDLLIGGNSKNTFFYCKGNGNDTIQSTNNGDFVMLSDISMDQITSANITDNAVVLNFADGGSLQINGSDSITYQLSNGSKFSANHKSRSWETK